jgi:hypothetical protein
MDSVVDHLVSAMRDAEKLKEQVLLEAANMWGLFFHEEKWELYGFKH